MKKSKKVVLGAMALGALAPLAADKAGAATASLNVQAVIRQAISATFGRTLHFGNLSTTVNAGTASLTPQNVTVRSVGGAGGLNLAGGALHQSARLDISAASGAVLNVSINTFPIVLTHATAADTMTVDKISIANTATGPVTRAYTATGVAQTFAMPGAATTVDLYVGGRLNKAAGALTPGTYANATDTQFFVNYQ